MKESKKPHVNIGIIGHVDHSKNTLMEAIRIVLEREENKVDDGGLEMIKGIKNYVGSTILGYRFVLDKESSKKIKGNKTSVNKQKRNSMYKIKTFRNRTFSRNK